LTCVKQSADADDVAERLADAITGQLTRVDPAAPADDTGRNMYQRFRYPIWYSLSELLMNAVTHAKMHGHPNAQVWVAAQFYEANNEVKLSVVDNGCGMLRTLRGHPELESPTDVAAIRAALQPKVSCNRETGTVSAIGHGNQGVGLTTTMRIAQAARGKLMIASGTGYVETSERRGSILANDGEWRGVAIAFSCRRNALPSVNVNRLMPVERTDAPVPLQFLDD
jgi:anti-sigma regulatory factor (Ser/Thr protein kinase)